ncbi:unnamed protein product [Timema podura]|uniref:Uncharacterized protein n=1 Tax=Timema podura TaxID=61482 RepID=A0ABN7NZK2_TIMPD|nr:unnamed protein product [Timema podura]
MAMAASGIMVSTRNAFKVLTGKPNWKRPLLRPIHRCEDNIRMDLKEIEFNEMDWIELAQDKDRLPKAGKKL